MKIRLSKQNAGEKLNLSVFNAYVFSWKYQ